MFNVYVLALSSSLFKVENSEAPNGFGGYGKEFWIDTTVVVLKHIGANRNPFIAILSPK